MAEILWMLACKQSIVDQRTNNVTLVNITEQISGPIAGGPDPQVLAIQLTVVALWRRAEQSDEEVTYRLRWLDQAGKEMRATNPISFKMPKSEQRHRTFHTFYGLPVEEPGRYSFVLQCLGDDGKYKDVGDAGSYDIEINRQAEA